MSDKYPVPPRSRRGYTGRGRSPADPPAQGNTDPWPYPIYPEPGEDRFSPSFLARVAAEHKEA